MPKWTKIVSTFPAQGEILRGLLESQGIPVQLIREGAGEAMGIVIGSLGKAHIYVPPEFEENAQLILDDFFQENLQTDE